MEAKDIISSGILELYATGVTSMEETMQVQQWVAQYPEVAAELAQIEASIDAFANLKGVAPGSNVKEKLFAKINEATAAPSKTVDINNITSETKITGISSYWKYAAAACIVLLIGSVAYNYSLQNKNDALAKKLEQNQQRIAELQEKNKHAVENLAVLKDKNNLLVNLHGLEAAPTASAKIFWKQTTGEVYLDPSDLPDAPKGKQYQLWAIVDGKPVDAGMITAANAEEKTQVQKMKSFPKAEAFAITLESEAGNIAPKGTMYVMGKV